MAILSFRSILIACLSALFLSACAQEPPGGQKEVDPAFRFGVDQVRFVKKGIFPFDFLIGYAFLDSDKVIIGNDTWYPDPKRTAIRMFEDGIERSVLEVHRISDYKKKPNVLAIVMVTEGLVVGPGGGKDLHPGFRDTLKGLSQGYDDGHYNLSVVFCWGKVERRYPFTSKEVSAQYVTDMDALIYPGASEGSFMSCLEPNLADFDWMQRATKEQAQDATLKNGTLPMFITDSQNWRNNVLLITDGEPFREGTIDIFSDLIIKNNFSLYTVGVSSGSNQETGLARLFDLYERRKIGGSFIRVEEHEKMPKLTKSLIERWLSDGNSFVVEYISGFSGLKGTELNVWGSWKDGQYTSRQIRVVPGQFNNSLRLVLRSLVVLFLVVGFIYFLWYFKIWPFKEKLRVISCPEGCGHLIPEDWPVCRFCEMKGVWGRLVILNGDKTGKVFYLKNDYYSVGSGKDDDIIVTHLPEFPVQPAHASLHWVQQGQKIVIRTDGGATTVGTRKVEGNAANLRFGDVVELGEGGVSAVLLRGVGRTW